MLGKKSEPWRYLGRSGFGQVLLVGFPARAPGSVPASQAGRKCFGVGFRFLPHRAGLACISLLGLVSHRNAFQNNTSSAYDYGKSNVACHVTFVILRLWQLTLMRNVDTGSMHFLLTKFAGTLHLSVT